MNTRRRSTEGIRGHVSMSGGQRASQRRRLAGAPRATTTTEARQRWPVAGGPTHRSRAGTQHVAHPALLPFTSVKLWFSQSSLSSLPLRHSC
uniref:Uncharacterized protein n=1 Tax=Setaria viridis TaxID=4556 RepID=A0A4U6TI11_SETVI|nr:hypothetical protein SEVIR_8G118050v2 [Setaria viridis]